MSLFVREAGPLDAPCIVFLHGLGISSVMWQPQIERLSHEYHCLAPDLPEHGNCKFIAGNAQPSLDHALSHRQG